MSHHVHDRLIATGFAMAYVGLLGLLLLLSSPNLTPRAEALLDLGLATLAVVGGLIVAAAKLLPIRAE